MRIISGKARGTKLYSLEGKNTRPTLDRVKESLFNIISQDIPESIFLDLFSGSGSIGIESASRGAKKAILCDNSKEAIEVIKKNVKKAHMEDNIEIYQKDYKTLLEENIKDILDIIYIDPPYITDFAYKALEIIIKKKLINEKSLIIIETDREEEIIKQIENLKLTITDKRKYGRIHLIFLMQKSDM